jgi:hypothetical protein
MGTDWKWRNWTKRSAAHVAASLAFLGCAFARLREPFATRNRAPGLKRAVKREKEGFCFPGACSCLVCLIRGLLLSHLLLCGAAARGQEPPQRLPSPDVPVYPLPPPGPGVAQPGAPYLGPPAGIDGPQILPPGGIEFTPGYAPGGIAPDDYLPLPGSPVGPLLSEDAFYEFYEDDYYAPQKLSPYKSGFFQKLSLSAAWFGNSRDARDLGGTEIETFLTVALPAPIREWPLLISPGYNVTFIDGPTVTDVPPKLYFTYVDFTWLPTIVHRYTLLLSVAPSVFGDFQEHEFRLTGKGLVIYDWVPDRLQFIAGVLYLNRENVRLLPAGGVIWTPADWARFEILFPKPKFGLRYNVGAGFEDWVFFTAEFGGNTWPIERESGAVDTFTYVDYRLLVGVERKINGGAGYRLEAGYVFGRDVDYGSGLGDFRPRDTFVLRGGLTF